MTNPLIEDIKNIHSTVQIMLPTKGMYYEPGILKEGLSYIEELNVGAISVLDENYYMDPFLLASGKAIEKFVKQVCPSVAHPEKLCEVDVEAILLASRFASYGDVYEITHTCNNPKIKEYAEDNSIVYECKEKAILPINLLEILSKFNQFDSETSPIKSENFQIQLPSSEQLVQLRPMTYEASLRLYKEYFMISKKYKDISDVAEEDIITDEDTLERYSGFVEESKNIVLLGILDSVYSVRAKSGIVVTDRDHIQEWLLSLTETDFSFLKEKVNDIVTLLKSLSIVEYECTNCGYLNKVPIPLDMQRLFTKAGISKPVKTSSASSTTTKRKGKTSSRILQR